MKQTRGATDKQRRLGKRRKPSTGGGHGHRGKETNKGGPAEETERTQTEGPRPRAAQKRLTGFHGLTLQKKPPVQSPRLHLRELRGRLRSLQPSATGSGSIQPRALTVWQATSLSCSPASHHLEHCAGSSQVRGRGQGQQAVRGRRFKGGRERLVISIGAPGQASRVPD